MKIEWKQNPLETVVELDDHDKEVLRLKLKVEHLEDRMASAYYDLSPDHREWMASIGKGTTLEEATATARKNLDPGHDDSEWLEMGLQHLVRALREPHEGDCTCIPCSCLKCRAESLLGIDTIPGLGKHQACKVLAAFSKGRNIDVAITWLEDYEPVKTSNWDRHPPGEFELHVPRWRREAAEAKTWLEGHRSRLAGGDSELSHQ